MTRRAKNTAGHFLAKFSLVAGLVIFVIGGVIWGLWGRSVGTGPLQKFEIEAGSSVIEIANNLKNAGLIRSPLYFRYIVKANKLTLQAGVYQIGPAAPPREIAELLTKGKSEQVKLTIPEGFRREQIAELAEKTLGVSAKDFLALTKNEEGKLFPDTYYVEGGMTAAAIITQLQNNYVKKAGAVQMDDLILASLIERETKHDEEKAIVAGILKKRLSAGWPLELDATVQYVLGKKENWWPNTTVLDRKIKSPFNTYETLGLPPAPICNPGLAAIKAAQNPSDSPYWFYLHEPDGTIHYAATVAEHNENIDKFLR